MKKLLHFYQNTAERSRGQALVVIAVSFVALLLFVGLAIDGGMILVNYGNLRRSVDAASLAAASQVRDSTTFTDIELVAKSTMELNGVANTTVIVKTCEDTTNTPASFQNACASTVPRKLVYVQGNFDSPLAFMRLLGFSTIRLNAWSVGEAAAVDVVLVIDVSDSLAGDTTDADTYYRTTTEPTGNWSENPDYCNAEGTTIPPDEPCMPFHFVKDAAIGFAQNILDKDYNGQPGEEDRIAIATFAVGYDSGYTKVYDIGGAPWSSDYTDVENTLNSLTVYPGSGACQPDESVLIAPHIGKCRGEDLAPDFRWDCAPAISNEYDYDNASGVPDLSTCGTTSIGSGLLNAGFLVGISATERPNAIRVVILLTDGANNATGPKFEDCATYTSCDVETDIHPLLLTTPKTDHYFGYCPDNLGAVCRDADVLTRHRPDLSTWQYCPMLLNFADLGSMVAPECPSNYDADDFAMDVAEFVGCPSILPTGSNCRKPGQGAVIFTIGMGDQVSSGSVDTSGRPYGAYMLRFISAVGEDGQPLDNSGGNVEYDMAGDSCIGLYDNQTEFETACGNYYFAEDAQSLGPVFEAIAARIFTRIAQ